MKTLVFIKGRIRECLAIVFWSLTCVNLQAASNDVEQLASANASFGFSLMKQVVGERPNENIFVSPYSVSAALQMVWQGAAGQTRAEMEQALALSNFKTEAAGTAYKELDNSIKSALATLAFACVLVMVFIWAAPGVGVLRRGHYILRIRSNERLCEVGVHRGNDR